jgi:putative ABC transport system permease protein
VARDVDEELAFHLALAEDELVRDGLPREVARARVRERFGDIEYTRRYCREADMDRQAMARRADWAQELAQDVRYALRQLVRAPGFTAVALLTLALGIGANTAIFSVVNGVVLKPLPFAEPHRVIRIHSTRHGDKAAVSAPDFLDWRRDSRSFESMAAYYDGTSNLTGRGDPVRLTVGRVTADFFRVLRAPALVGRTFAPNEDEATAARAAVLSYGLWERSFGGDPSIVGRVITLDGDAYTVIGVAPPSVRYPVGTEVWLPFVMDANDRSGSSRGARYLGVIGRLAPGATLEHARGELATIAARIEREDPKHNTNFATLLEPLRDALVGGYRTPLFVLLGAVAFVMVIACANVANLMLVRTSARETEIAVRISLGAGRGRLVRQLLTESVVLSLLGGALGFALAVAGTRAFVALAPHVIPRMDEVRADGAMLAFTLGVALVTGIAFGLVPALHGVSPRLAQRLREGGRGGRTRPGRQRARSALTVAELALAVMLLAGAGLLVRSFARLTAVDPGFRTSNLVTFTVSLPESQYAEIAKQRAFANTLLERMRAMPGVSAAAFSMGLPLSDTRFSLSFTVDEHPPVPPENEPSAQVRVDSDDYFETLGIPVVRGRGFRETDRAGAPMVAVINETMARRFFADEDPIGKHIRQGWTRDGAKLGGEIVGVVRDTKQLSLRDEVRPEIHYSAEQWPIDGLSVVVRTTAPPATALAAARDALHGIDPNLPMFDARTIASMVDDSVAEPRFYMTLLGIFAAVALALAAVGIYGVIAYGVAQRSHEIGVRMALGASAHDVSRMVVRQGTVLAVIGVVVGLVGAFALTRLMASLLYGVTASDPVTFAVVPLVLGLVALLACWLPARRAARVDPLEAMRAE